MVAVLTLSGQASKYARLTYQITLTALKGTSYPNSRRALRTYVVQ
jgi:hypothetical protein